MEEACITLIAGGVEGEGSNLKRELGAQEEEGIVTRGGNRDTASREMN